MAKPGSSNLKNKSLVSLGNLDYVPWSIDGHIQNKNSLNENIATLAQGLKLEAGGEPRVHVVSIFEVCWQKYLKDLLLSLKNQVWPNISITIITYSQSQKKIVQRISREVFVTGTGVICYDGGRKHPISDLLKIQEQSDFSREDFFALVNMSDLVHPLAFYHIIETSKLDQKHNFFYPNVTKVSPKGSLLKSFCHKPDFDISTLIRRNFLGTFCLIKAGLLEQIGRKPSQFSFEGTAPFGWHPLFLALSQLNGFKPRHISQFLYLERLVPWPVNFPKLSQKTYAQFFAFISKTVADHELVASQEFKLKFSRKKPYFEVVNEGAKKKKILIVVYFQGVSYQDKRNLNKVIKNIQQQNQENITVEILCLGSRPDGCEALCKKNKAPLSIFFFPLGEDMKVFPRHINEGIEKCALNFDHLMLWRHDLVFEKKTVLKTLCGELSFNPKLAGVCTRSKFKKDQGFSGLLLEPTESNKKLVFKTREMKGDDYGTQERTSAFVNYSGVLLNKAYWDSIKKEKIDLLSTDNQVIFALMAAKRGLGFFYFGSCIGRLQSPDSLNHLHGQVVSTSRFRHHKNEVNSILTCQYHVKSNVDQ